MNSKKFGELKKRIGLFKNIKSGAGFTLIELIIVICVIGIVSAMAMGILNPLEQFQKANDARRKTDLAQIQRALEQYYQDNKRYPVATSFKITAPGGSVIDWGQSWLPYMPTLPSDPSSPTKRYVYYSDPALSGQAYYLYASLDRGGKDLQVCYPGQEKKCDNAGGASCGSGLCNYGVTSPNVSP